MPKEYNSLESVILQQLNKLGETSLVNAVSEPVMIVLDIRLTFKKK